MSEILSVVNVFEDMFMDKIKMFFDVGEYDL